MEFIDEKSKTISVIAAMSENQVIGRNNKLPWDIPEDLQRFKELTLGATVIMGRKTYESVGDLPGRYIIVVSETLKSNLVHVVNSVPKAIAIAPTENVFIAGGTNIYKEGIPYADFMYLTIIHEEFFGDTFFPDFEEKEWGMLVLENFGDYSFLTLKRLEEDDNRSQQQGGTQQQDLS